jgi:hypothetical protein
MELNCILDHVENLHECFESGQNLMSKFSPLSFINRSQFHFVSAKLSL